VLIGRGEGVYRGERLPGGETLRRRAAPEARLGAGSAVAYRLLRERVPFLAGDAVLAPLFAAAQTLVADDGFVAAVEEATGGMCGDSKQNSFDQGDTMSGLNDNQG